MACPTTTPIAYVQCAGAPVIFGESQVSTFADRVGASGGTGNWVRTYVVACLLANRLIYWKVRPGDCGTATKVQPSIGGAIAQQEVAGALSTIPIAGPMLSMLSQFLPFQHHAQAVATEQGTLCDVFLNWNGFCNAIEYAIQSGQLPLADAIQRMQSESATLQAEANAIVNGKINSAYGVVKALKAMTLLNAEVVYPSLMPAAASGPVSGALNSISQLIGLTNAPASALGAAGVSNPSSKLMLIIAAIIGGALLIL
jgi:hypothetical protein